MAGSAIKSDFWGSLRIHDRESCAKAIRNGGIAALFSAGITTIFSVIGLFTRSSDKTLDYFIDPWSLIDVAFVVVLAIFVFRKSRVASTLLLIYFVISKILMWMEMGKPQGLVMAIIFFLYYATAMRGTYIWHSSYGNSSDNSIRH